MNQPEPTKKEGLFGFNRINLSEIQKTIARKVSQTATLTDLAKDFELFNHSVLFLFTTIGFDPLSLLLSRHKEIEPALVTSHDFPMFDGLIPFWNHTVIAVPKEQWKRVHCHLDQTAVLDGKQRSYACALRQQLPVLDVLAMAKKATVMEGVPTVDVEMYGLDGNKNCLHFIPAKHNELPIFKLKIDQPNEEIKRLAEAILKGHDKPFSTMTDS